MNGTRIASADRVGRKNWTVEADGRTYEFRRASLWRQEEELHSEGPSVGSVRRKSIWRGDAVADFPGLPLSVQVFVLAVALTKWDSDAAAVATVWVRPPADGSPDLNAHPKAVPVGDAGSAANGRCASWVARHPTTPTTWFHFLCHVARVLRSRGHRCQGQPRSSQTQPDRESRRFPGCNTLSSREVGTSGCVARRRRQQCA
jgi:hypothetical protein